MIVMSEQEIELVSGGADLPGYPEPPRDNPLNPGNPWYPDVEVAM